MTKEQLARWRGKGFEFDEFYDTITVDTVPKIVSIEIIYKEIISDNKHNFTIKIVLDYNIENNILVVNLNERTFSTYQKNSIIQDMNTFYSDVYVNFSTVIRLEENFTLTTILNNFKTNQVMDSKSITVNVKNDGKVSETKDKVEDVKPTNTSSNDISIDELKQIFNTASYDIISEVVDAFNEGVDYFELNNCLRKAHFFAQALKEVGSGFSIKKPESLNYPAEGLKNGYWFTKGNIWIKGNKEKNLEGHFKVGTKKATINFSYTKTHPEIADQYGRKDLNKYGDGGVQKANSVMLSNYVYANRIGNGDPETGDGNKFRGKGLIQLTGRTNYENVNKVIQKFDKNLDIVNNPDEILTDVRLAVISAMGFWKLNNINKVIGTDKSDTIVAKVTNIVNSGEDASNMTIRLNCFNNITKIVFNIKDCKL
jgi:predicted chitinase